MFQEKFWRQNKEEMEEKPAVAYLRAANGYTINLGYGSNKIGRDNLAVPDKRVSRHHGNSLLNFDESDKLKKNNY